MSAATSTLQRPTRSRPLLEQQLVAAAEREHRSRLAEIAQMHRLLKRLDRFGQPLAELGIRLGDRRVFNWNATALQIMPPYAEARDDALCLALRALGLREVGRTEGADGRCWARLALGRSFAIKVAVSSAPKGGAA